MWYQTSTDGAALRSSTFTDTASVVVTDTSLDAIRTEAGNL